ncbi:glycoside hydrolase family 43 protein [Arachidicoccus rhizosphaerae]|nr:glycoside hydrolase family 43 protein [Arachidicoccus rhizosphaerae]
MVAFLKNGWAQNPIVQTCYTTDPAPMVYKDTVFVYTGHDENSAKYFEMKDWKVFSSTDMVNWTNRGTPLSVSTFSWAKENAWAGQCIERNGKFYWYVPVTGKVTGNFAIGVAVSDYASGPFKDALGKPLVAPGFGYIDPTVFIDNDGQAYLYWGNPGLWYVKLNKDMLSYSGDVQTVPLTTEAFGKRYNDPKRATQYEEGPWFYHRNNLYYMLYAAGGVPEHIAYSTSNNPVGPWTYRDTIMTIQGKSFTNHCGVIDFKGSSYFFYHNGALPGGGGFARSVCVEPFTYNSDGSFPRINMTAGVKSAVINLNPYQRTEAETIAWEEGVETAEDKQTGVYVTEINNKDYIKLRDIDFGKGAKSFEARIASGGNGGKIELHLDSLNGKLVGICNVQNTGGWLNWTTAKCKVRDAKGKHDLYLVFSGGEGELFNFDWWRFH